MDLWSRRVYGFKLFRFLFARCMTDMVGDERGVERSST
jgi:hypothetical protein